VSQFAAEAGMPQSKMSAILRGYEGLGPVRRARIEQAIVRLRLDRPPTAVPHHDPLDQPVLRVRRGG
jgi:hypothetical protein